MDRQQQRTDKPIPPPVAAAAAARQAAAAPADDAQQHNDRGILLARRSMFDDAAMQFRTAIALRPGFAKAHNNLGIVYAQQGRLADAMAAFRAALAYRPDMAEAQSNLGNVLAMQDRPDEAIECFRRATNLRQNYAEAYNNLGIALAGQGRLPEAVAAFERALHLKPGQPEPQCAMPAAKTRGGTTNGAESCAARPLETASSGAACLNLAGVKRFSAAGPHLAALEALTEPGRDIPHNSRIALHFALGKAYDDGNEPDRAFAHFLAGNTLKRASLGYDEAAALGAMQQAQRHFSADFIGSLRDPGDASAAPIFIVGMPRSGITLLAQMLANHPDVLAAGERTDFSRLAGAIPGPDTLVPKTLKQLGTDYLASIHGKTLRHARVTDKMPGNFLHAGLIHLALPRARIIHLRRSAADTCFSCFTKLFPLGHAYSFDLAELGRYHRAYAQLMAHWRNVLPGSVLIDVDYEALVADPKGQVARILDHCALPWSDSCLPMHQNLHGRSVGRWQRYAAHLAPLLSALLPGPT